MPPLKIAPIRVFSRKKLERLAIFLPEFGGFPGFLFINKYTGAFG
jgi:hypothetical protein